MRLAALYIYPIKSTAPLALQEACVERRGLAHDRRWMVVDASGRFVTGRQTPRMTLIRARPLASGLELQAPGMATLFVTEPGDAERLAATVWGDTIDAQVYATHADAWLSEFLGQPVRLVHMDADAVRPIDPDYSQPGDEVSFADGYPLLVIGQSALDGLNARLRKPVSMLQFRPNLVIDGVAAHAEDQWRRVRIGGVEFDAVKPCVRCVFTTVDPERGERDPDGEPLRTLVSYRRLAKGVSFGQQLIPRGPGVVRAGDCVEVLA